MAGCGVAVDGEDVEVGLGENVAVEVGVEVESGGVFVPVEVGREVETWCPPRMSSSWPILIRSLVRLLNSVMASTVVLNLRAMPLRVSPACTV